MYTVWRFLQGSTLGFRLRQKWIRHNHDCQPVRIKNVFLILYLREWKCTGNEIQSTYNAVSEECKEWNCLWQTTATITSNSNGNIYNIQYCIQTNAQKCHCIIFHILIFYCTNHKRAKRKSSHFKLTEIKSGKEWEECQQASTSVHTCIQKPSTERAWKKEHWPESS